MRYRIFFCLIVLGLLVSACKGTSTPAENSAATAEVSEPVSVSDTATSVSIAESNNAPAPGTSTPTLLAPSDLQLTTNCTVVSRNPTPGPTEQSLFPPVSEGDWVNGPEEAEVTFIEYSDFQ